VRPLVHYFVEQKNHHHGIAIAEGFKARRVKPNGRLIDGAIHLIGGLQFGSLELLEQARLGGEPYIFFDRAYFGGGPGSNILRVVPTAYQHWWQPGSKAEGRSQKSDLWSPVMKPWRTDGRHVLVVPPSAAVEILFGVGGWLDRAIARLKACTNRPLVVSFKGEKDQAPLHDRLKDCWAVVTFTSNVAVEAVCAGIPVFCHTESAASPVGNWSANLEERIERPRMPDTREAWAAGLVAGQFALSQIADGTAAAKVLPHFNDA